MTVSGWLTARPPEKSAQGSFKANNKQRNPGSNSEVGVPGTEGRQDPHGASVGASGSRGSVWEAGEARWPGRGQPRRTESVLDLECGKGDVLFGEVTQQIGPVSRYVLIWFSTCFSFIRAFEEVRGGTERVGTSVGWGLVGCGRSQGHQQPEPPAVSFQAREPTLFRVSEGSTWQQKPLMWPRRPLVASWMRDRKRSGRGGSPSTGCGRAGRVPAAGVACQ